MLNFETDQQTDIIMVNYSAQYDINYGFGYVLPAGAYNLFDDAPYPIDDCELIWSYDTVNYNDGSTGLKTEGILITNANGDATKATCQIKISLVGEPIGTEDRLFSNVFDLGDSSMSANIYIPNGSPIDSCMIILQDSTGEKTVSTQYAFVSEGWNLVSYGFDSFLFSSGSTGRLISINGESVGPLDSEEFFMISDVARIVIRLGGPVSANGVAGSANCTINNIDW